MQFQLSKIICVQNDKEKKTGLKLKNDNKNST